MRAEVRQCATDQDYAALTRFYLQHCREFDGQYMLQDGLAHLISTISDSRFLLFHDQKGEMIAFIQYRCEKDQKSVCIDSAILVKEFRSSRVFYEGLRDLAKCIRNDYPETDSLYFFAIADDKYINRLYRKFAEIVDVGERNGRKEHVYAVNMDQLFQYLKLGF